MDTIVLFGTSHHLAPVEWRERLVLRGDACISALRRLRERLPEVAILSTCNRLEIYAVAAGAFAAQAVIGDFLTERHAVKRDELQERFYSHAGRAAVAHLFTVAAGLDSMLLGEAQILGQVGDALRIAQQAQTVGPVLTRLFQEAVATGREARSQTEIGRGALSLGYAAVELARSIFRDAPPQRVLVIGAGEMAEKVTQCLTANQIGSILVANRTFERAQDLAARFGGRAVHFGSIADALTEADIVIASSAAPHTVIHRDTVERAMRVRRGRELFLIDIAVPRDVDPHVAEIPGVHLYSIDDLRGVCDANLARRQSEADQVRAIVEAETERFVRWLAARASAPTVSALCEKAEATRQRELERTLRHLRELSPEQCQAVETFSRSLVRKLLQEPVQHLQQPEDGWGHEEYLAIARSLFGLELADQGNAIEEETAATEPAPIDG